MENEKKEECNRAYKKSRKRANLGRHNSPNLYIRIECVCVGSVARSDIVGVAGLTKILTLGATRVGNRKLSQPRIVPGGYNETLAMLVVVASLNPTQPPLFALSSPFEFSQGLSGLSYPWSRHSCHIVYITKYICIHTHTYTPLRDKPKDSRQGFSGAIFVTNGCSI